MRYSFTQFVLIDPLKHVRDPCCERACGSRVGATAHAPASWEPLDEDPRETLGGTSNEMTVLDAFGEVHPLELRLRDVGPELLCEFAERFARPTSDESIDGGKPPRANFVG